MIPGPLQGQKGRTANHICLSYYDIILYYGNTLDRRTHYTEYNTIVIRTVARQTFRCSCNF